MLSSSISIWNKGSGMSFMGWKERVETLISLEGTEWSKESHQVVFTQIKGQWFWYCFKLQWDSLEFIALWVRNHITASFCFTSHFIVRLSASQILISNQRSFPRENCIKHQNIRLQIWTYESFYCIFPCKVLYWHYSTLTMCNWA
jgi:hypothetical protein